MQARAREPARGQLLALNLLNLLSLLRLQLSELVNISWEPGRELMEMNKEAAADETVARHRDGG